MTRQQRGHWIGASVLALALLHAGSELCAPPSEPSGTIQEEKILNSLRKSLSVLPNWKMRIADLQPSPFPGLYQAVVEFRNEDAVRTQSVFVSSDSRLYVVGNLYDANVDMDQARRNLIRIEGSPYKGAANAKVTIVEYSDFQCSSCKTAHEAMVRDRILESYPGKVKLVYKNLPFPKFHPWALRAAVAAMCAHEQNPKAFWKLHDDLFTAQPSITPENLRDQVLNSAQAAGLNSERFAQCLDQQTSFPRVQADMEEAGVLGIGSTPTFLINGRIIAGYPGAAPFKQLIEEFLK